MEKAENKKSKWNEMKWSTSSAWQTRRLRDPATLRPSDLSTPPRRQLNMPTLPWPFTSPSVWFGNLLRHITNMPSLLIGLLASPTANSRCLRVCMWPYTCSCRTLTSRNSRKFNHAQLTRADRRLLQSLLTLSCPCQGAATRARVGSDFFLPASRLDNHVEYLALMSPHSTSISFLVWPDLAAVQYFFKKSLNKKSKRQKVPPTRPLTRCSPAAIIVFAVLCCLPATEAEKYIHYCPNKAKGGGVRLRGGGESLTGPLPFALRAKAQKNKKEMHSHWQRQATATFCCTWCTCFTSGNWWFSTSRATIKRAACQQNANNQSININQAVWGVAHAHNCCRYTTQL